MKTKIVLAVIAFCISLTGFAQNKLFDKLSGNKDIIRVTINKTLLDMMPKDAMSSKMFGMDIEEMVTKLDQIDVFTSENEVAKQLIREETTNFFKENKTYEELMKVKEEGNNVTFYVQKENALVKSLVMFVDGDDECVLIHLIGKFELKDVQQILNQAKNK